MPTAREVLEKSFAFNRVTRQNERANLTKGTEYERELASQADVTDASDYYGPEFGSSVFENQSASKETLASQPFISEPDLPQRFGSLPDEEPLSLTPVIFILNHDLIE